MNAQIEVNGADKTEFVHSYIREQKICTGIGTLQVSFINTFGEGLETWDKVVLTEDGHVKGQYYICSISNSEPEGLRTVVCQDSSKRLTDNFIDQNYYVDYLSYSGAWISFFLDEVGVEYDFLTDSIGSPLSLNTSLGMCTTYDQIIQLLQLSGWYMFFDSDDRCKIGKLSTDINDITDRLHSDRILSINQIKSDKMLRNRVIVWGNSDPTASSWVIAEEHIKTPWNYNDKDLRTVVIANSAIPNIDTAEVIANIVLLEFAKLTIEKHIEIEGASGSKIGQFVNVRSGVFNGLGLVTTVGSTLDPDGFKTQFILDERCPRLFGYYDFGDYVYVSTFGEGIWRKHLNFDPMWYPYASISSSGGGGGMVDTRVTDMYKNMGLLSAVTANGGAFWSMPTEEESWNNVQFSGLVTVLTPTPQTEYDPIISGAYIGPLTARAITHDKETNNLRIAVDNNIADNYIDYATGADIHVVIGDSTTVSGGDPGPTFSGTTTSGVQFGNGRAWILDYNTGLGTIENYYPIHVSGVYDLHVLDIENDGLTDYVTIMVSGKSVPFVDDQNEYGMFEGQQFDGEGVIAYSNLIGPDKYVVLAPSLPYQVVMAQSPIISTYDDVDERSVVGCTTDYPASSNQYMFAAYLDYVTYNFTENYRANIPSNLQWLGIHKFEKYIYCLFGKTGVGTYKMYEVNVKNNTIEEKMSYTVPSDTPNYIIEKFDYNANTFNVARSKAMVYGTRIEHYGTDNFVGNYASRLSLISFDLENYTVTDDTLYDTHGLKEHPRVLSTYAYLTGEGDMGPLIKVAEYWMDVDMESYLAYNVFFRILAFSSAKGNGLEKFEHENWDSQIPSHYWFARELSVGIGQGGAQNTYVNSVYAGMNKGPVGGRSVESVYPISEDYLFNPSTNYISKYTQTGAPLADCYFNSANSLADIRTKTTKTVFTAPLHRTIIQMLPHVDTRTGSVYAFAIDTTTSFHTLLEYTQNGNFIKEITLNHYLGTVAVVHNSGNFIISVSRGNVIHVLYIRALEIDEIHLTLYQLLRRDGTEFKVIRTDMLNMRLDNSQATPLISLDNSLKTTSITENFLSDFKVHNITTAGILESKDVFDFKYTNTQLINQSGVNTGGSNLSTDGYVFIHSMDDGIHQVPIGQDGLSLGEDRIIFNPNTTASGETSEVGTVVVARLETSNYKLPQQYIFAATSGDGSFRFFQAGPIAASGILPVASGIFYEYTETFPQTTATRIRLDDRI